MLIITSISVPSTEQDSLPSTSTCNPSYPPIRAECVSTKHTDSKRKRLFWPQHVKNAMLLELSDCLEDWAKLTEERAINFLAKFNMEDRGHKLLKNVLYNLTRGPRKK